MTNIKKARLNKGISQQRLASLLNVAQTSVSSWESGKHTPTKEKLILLYRILDTNVDYLLDISNNPTRITTFNQNVGNSQINIKKARLNKNISQKELAIILNVAQPTISAWEAGKKTPSKENFKILCQILDTTSDYLLGISGDPNKIDSTDTPTKEITPAPEKDAEVDEKIMKNAKRLYHVLLGAGYIEEGQELTPEQKEKLIDIFKNINPSDFNK